MDGGDSQERARPRSRSRSPGPSARRYRERSRSRSRSRERADRDRFPTARRRSRSRSPPRRRGGDRYDDRHDDRRYDSRRGGRDDDRYSSSRGGDRDGDRRSGYRETTDRAANREAVAQEAIKNSKKENRVYVGNLSFQVRWHDLKDFCSAAGEVIFAEIIQLPNGMSKGCGIVEYATREEAERAVRDLNEGQLFGRPAFLREDREDEARFGAAAISGRTTFPGASQQTGAPSSRPGRESGVPAVFAPPGPRGLFVTGMTPEIGWQDMKDLFRRAGEVQRADVNIDHSTGISKGTGVVVMANKADADEAIAMFNGYEFEGGRLEVREDRFFHINQARAQARGGRPPREDRDGYRGGYSGDRSTEDLYGEYSGRGDGEYGRRDEYDRDRSGGGRAPPAGPQFAREPIRADPSPQIFVNNLPWSTSNEDLVELFQTTGTVVAAEMIWENGRSKGNGIVQFDDIQQAESAIAKFSGYLYGGRPLKLAFNARWKAFEKFLDTPANGTAGDAAFHQDANGNGEYEGGAIDSREEVMAS